MLRLFVLMLLVGFLATVGSGTRVENNLGQGLSIDGPGGYLPDASSMISNINSNSAFDNSNMAFDSGSVFAIEPPIRFNNFMTMQTVANFGDIWDKSSNWNSLFDVGHFSFYP